MTTGRYSRRNASFRPTGERRTDRENNFFLGMVGFSLVVHVVAAAIFLHDPTSPIQRRPPMLSVDLVMAPVANPQRGSAGAIRKITEPVAVAPSQPAVPTKVAKEPVKEVKKTPVVKDDEGLAAAMAKMRQRKDEQDELKDTQAAIAALKKKTKPAPPSTAAAVGSASGTGDEAGGDIRIWIKESLTAQWSLSRYQIKNPNLKVDLVVRYDKKGKLIFHEFKWSGNKTFDESIQKAFNSFSKENLPATFLTSLQSNFEEKITITPKELFEK